MLVGPAGARLSCTARRRRDRHASKEARGRAASPMTLERRWRRSRWRPPWRNRRPASASGAWRASGRRAARRGTGRRASEPAGVAPFLLVFLDAAEGDMRPPARLLRIEALARCGVRLPSRCGSASRRACRRRARPAAERRATIERRRRPERPHVRSPARRRAAPSPSRRPAGSSSRSHRRAARVRSVVS